MLAKLEWVQLWGTHNGVVFQPAPQGAPWWVINIINHKFDLLDVCFHEQGQVVDTVLVCDSNFTAVESHGHLISKRY